MRLGCVVALSLAVLGSPRAGAEEFALRYESRASDFSFLGSSSVELFATQVPPAGDWVLPPFSSKSPLFLLAPLGDRAVLLVLDRIDSLGVKSKGRGFTRVYCDSNGNRDLTDDPIVESRERSSAVWVGSLFSDEEIGGGFSAELTVTIEVDGHRTPYSFCIWQWPELESRQPEDGAAENSEAPGVTVQMLTLCHYAGEVTLPGPRGRTTYHVALYDRNLNGRFDDRGRCLQEGSSGRERRGSASGDSLLFAPRETRSRTSRDTVLFCDLLAVEDRAYRVSFDHGTAKLRLDPVTEPCGTIELSSYVEQISLTTVDDAHYVVGLFTRGALPLPAGSYQVESYHVFKRDPQGDLWYLAARGASKGTVFTVKDGECTRLEFGEPYSAEVVVSKNPRPGLFGSSKVSLGFRVRGIAGETVSDLRHVSGTRTAIPLESARPAPPSYTITKTTGEVVGAGSFSYG
ncbi:MAG: hypothetical protein AB1486_06890 [Planctomycetota bacterium]